MMCTSSKIGYRHWAPISCMIWYSLRDGESLMLNLEGALSTHKCMRCLKTRVQTSHILAKTSQPKGAKRPSNEPRVLTDCGRTPLPNRSLRNAPRLRNNCMHVHKRGPKRQSPLLSEYKTTLRLRSSFAKVEIAKRIPIISCHGKPHAPHKGEGSKERTNDVICLSFLAASLPSKRLLGSRSV